MHLTQKTQSSFFLATLKWIIVAAGLAVRWSFLRSLLSTLHGRLVGEHAQFKEELEVVRQDNIQLVRENNHIKQACEELRRLHDDDQREVADMRLLQKQVLVEFTVSLLLKRPFTSWS